MSIETIYVYLLEEEVDCWRPCRAEHLGGDRYRIIDQAPDDEVWQFATGDVVRCRIKQFVSEIEPVERLVAFELAT